jgi:hypothetical protein
MLDNKVRRRPWRLTTMGCLLASVALVAPAAASVMPAGLNFGAEPLQTTSAPKSLTIRCPTHEFEIFHDLDGSRHPVQSCTLIGLERSGPDVGDFAVGDPDCRDGTFGARKTCRMIATFTPSACGARTARVTVTMRLVIDETHAAREAYSTILRGRGRC